MDNQLSELVNECVQVQMAIDGREVNEPLHPTTALFGANGILDSIGLVNLIVLVEESIADRYNTAVTLADRRALLRANSPFRTVQSLADYAYEVLVKEA
jgi:acyl carrier protein